MQRGSLAIAGISAAGGAIALLLTVVGGDGVGLGSLLGVVLLANALVRYLIARRG